MCKECGLGQKYIYLYLSCIDPCMCFLLAKLGMQQQPSVGTSVGTSVDAAAGPLSGKSDVEYNLFQYKCIATILAAS